jgi:hypothetical protein
MQKRLTKIVIPSLIAAGLLLVGCGGGNSDSETIPIPKNLKMSTYINKGNFVEVASFAYKKVTDSTFTQNAMNISLPGGDEAIKLSTHSISVTSTQDKLNKIIVQNHRNRIDIKLLGDNRVNILLQGSNFTIDRKMALADFIAVN